MSEMTSRERVYAAANFEEPDRVPICFCGTTATGITECPPAGRTCSDLYEYLGLDDAAAVEISPVFNGVVNVDERLIQRLGSDVRSVGPSPPSVVTEDDGTKTWPWFCGMRIKKVGHYDEPFGWPMRHMETRKDIDDYPWPDHNIDVMEGVVERAKYLHEETDYFVVGETLLEMFPFNGYGYLSGIDKWLTDMKTRPEFYHQLAERFLEYTLSVADQFFGRIGKYLDGAVVFDDLGFQNKPMMSHSDYLEFYKPYTARIIKHVRQYLRPQAKIILHSCGSVHWAIPDFIDIGVNILNPVQALARDMEPWRLKKDFGGRIAFLGGLDIQQLLPLGSVEGIRTAVRKLFREYAPGGGYIFSMCHNIEPDSSPENIVAAFDAARECGRYPIDAAAGEEGYVDYILGSRLQNRGAAG